MLEKPNLEDEKIVACLWNDYGLRAEEVAFLPLGADKDTAVYRVIGDNATPYFLKLRRGAFNEMTVVVPGLLRDQGSEHVIAPLLTHSRQLWAALDEYKVILFPYVEGQNAFDAGLSDHHLVELGQTLKSLHTTALPPRLANQIERESFSPHWRAAVKQLQVQIEQQTFPDPVAAELAEFLRTKRVVVSELVNSAERLAAVLQSRALPYVLCHADIHVWNILIDTQGRLYIVDWDTLILAPRERDLMFIGGGLMRHGHTNHEEALFYEGYGQVQIDPVALAYYRCERIVEDIAAYCEQIVLTDAGGADRAEGLRQLKSQFLPGEVVEFALRSKSKGIVER